MLNRGNTGPKLRTKGAETRGVVPFAVELAQEVATAQPEPQTQAALQVATSLLDLYLCLGMEPFQPKLGADAARKCCIQYSALHNLAVSSGKDKLWKIKPKFHMFVELAEYQAANWGDPSFYWAYKDEDFMGWVATMASSKGGPKSAGTVAKSFLQRYLVAEGSS